MKRAQTELMGLAVIVVLVLIVLIFVVKFSVLDQPEQHKQEFTQTEIASNFVSTLLKTTNPDCRDLTFTEIFQDVAEGSPYVWCDNEKTIDYLPDKLDEIFADTLETWNIAYEFDAFVNLNSPNPIISSFPKKFNPTSGVVGCSKATSIKSKQFAIPIDSGGGSTLYIKLDICS